MKKMHTIVAHNRPFLFIVLPTVSKPIQITFSVPKKCLLAPLLYNDFATTATIKITSTTTTTVPTTTTTMVGFIYTFSKLLEIMACRLDLELEMWRYSGIAKSSCITQPHLWGQKSDIFLPEVIAHSERWTANNSKCFGWTQSDNNRTTIPRCNFKFFYAFKTAMAIAIFCVNAVEAI